MRAHGFVGRPGHLRSSALKRDSPRLGLIKWQGHAALNFVQQSLNVVNTLD